jgi:hypothetical protein
MLTGETIVWDDATEDRSHCNPVPEDLVETVLNGVRNSFEERSCA